MRAISFSSGKTQTAVFFDYNNKHLYRRTQTLNPHLRIGAPGNYQTTSWAVLKCEYVVIKKRVMKTLQLKILQCLSSNAYDTMVPHFLRKHEHTK